MERGKNPDIIKGRMPAAVVHLLRFGYKDLSTKDAAAKFGTTVGKVDDVKKNRNFAYVVEDTKFTDAQIAEGIEWLKRHPKFDEAGADALVVELDKYERANDDEAKAFEAARAAARGQSVKTKDGQIADGGGGNRRGKKKKDAEAEATETEGGDPDASALMD